MKNDIFFFSNIFATLINHFYFFVICKHKTIFTLYFLFYHEFHLFRPTLCIQPGVPDSLRAVADDVADGRIEDGFSAMVRFGAHSHFRNECGELMGKHIKNNNNNNK